ncbi:hypothetical protein M8J76_003023 [Diaphorina citri]|nr:hypothetical protein M8J76_003023 [Diaphorina citri]
MELNGLQIDQQQLHSRGLLQGLRKSYSLAYLNDQNFDMSNEDVMYERKISMSRTSLATDLPCPSEPMYSPSSYRRDFGGSLEALNEVRPRRVSTRRTEAPNPPQDNMMSSYIETQLDILRQILLRNTPNVQNKLNYPYVTNDIDENTRRENHRSAKLLESLLKQDARQIETKSAKLLESLLEEDFGDNLNVFQANNEIFINNIPLYRYIQFQEEQENQLNQLEPNPNKIQEHGQLENAVEDSETRNELDYDPGVNEEITKDFTNGKINKTNLDTTYGNAGQITNTNIVTNDRDEKIHKIDIGTPNNKVGSTRGNDKTGSEIANSVGTIDTQTCSSTAAIDRQTNKEEPIPECKNLEKLEKEYNQNIEHDTRENSDKVKLRKAKEFKASEHTSQVPRQSIDTRPNMKQNVENAIGQPSLVATASKSIRDNEQLGKGGNVADANVNFNTSNNKDVVNVPKENFTRTKGNFNTSNTKDVNSTKENFNTSNTKDVNSTKENFNTSNTKDVNSTKGNFNTSNTKDVNSTKENFNTSNTKDVNSTKENFNTSNTKDVNSTKENFNTSKEDVNSTKGNFNTSNTKDVNSTKENFNTSNTKDVNSTKENFNTSNTKDVNSTKENFNTPKEDVNRHSICSDIDAMSILSDTSSMHTDHGSTIQDSNEPRKGKYHKRKAPRPPSYVEDSKEFFI